MNQEIPKPLRNALARQVAGDVHPSPDVLTSFLERTLAPVESEGVTHHLAQCAECREIVFLASEAAEDEVRVERELVAATAASRVAPVPLYAASSRAAAALANASRPRWTGRMRWAVSIAAAAFLVSGGLVLQFSRAGSGHNAAPLTVASNRPAPARPEAQPTATAANSQENSAKASVPGTLAKAAPHRAMAAPAKKGPAQTTVARNAADQVPSAPAVQPSPQTTPSQATAGAVGDMNSVMVPEARPQSSFAESEAAQPLQLKQGAPALFGKSRMGMHAASAVRPQWRIGPDGHLERSMVADQWTRVLDDQPTAFRAVAAMGSDVWAGGNGGALFHSSDGGEHWSKVPLAAESNVETGDIVSIRFDDPQHGIVASDSGTRWATTDGGVTWTTQ
jgi:hypothetical protein